MIASYGNFLVGSVLLAATPVMATAAPADPKPQYAVLRPIPFTQVSVHDSFWAPRMKTTQEVTLPAALDACDERIRNFAIVAGTETGKLLIAAAPDSDLYKVIEGAAYSLAWRRAPELEKRVDAIIDTIASAQDKDGYLNTQYMLPLTHPASPPRTDRSVLRFGYGVRWSGTPEQWPRGLGQLYCAGHLFEAAAAYFRATGKRKFLDVACRMADNVYATFPPGQPIPFADHPQIETGLVRLYEATGEPRYLALADHIVHNGHPGRAVDFGRGESRLPFLEQRQAWGHCVRTAYLYAGATDVIAHLGRADTRAVVDSLWRSIVESRLYLHGGIGNGVDHEQHGLPYDLPNIDCYCECCANIAMGQWNQRLNLLTADGKYADIMEVEAYNGGLSGISLDGTAFFYSNLLTADLVRRRNQFSGVRRTYMFCCPSKLPGFVAGISRWAYATGDSGLYVNLYIAGGVTFEVDGCKVRMETATQYPWQGEIRIAMAPARPVAFDLCLRIPGWTRESPLPGGLYRFASPAHSSVRLKVNGEALPMPGIENGYTRIRRTWKQGDTVQLDLEMPVRRVHARDEVEADRGRVALMRGPLLYCLEQADHKDVSVLQLALPKDAPFSPRHRSSLLGGVTLLEGRGLAEDGKPVKVTAVPYYAWENRGVGEMTAWPIEDPELARPPQRRPQNTGREELDR